MSAVVVAGHVCIDLMPGLTGIPPVEPGALVEIGALDVRAGGAVSNTGIALADLGIAVRLSAHVGDDPLAELLRGALARAGVDAAGLTTVPSSTSYSIVLQSAGHDRTFWHHVGANAWFDGASVELEGADLLHFGYPSILPAVLTDGGDPLHRLLRRARVADVATSLDLAVVDEADSARTGWWRDFLASILPLVDIISPSVDDLASATGVPAGGRFDAESAARRLVGDGAAIAAVSAGRHGMALATGSADRFASSGAAVRTLRDTWPDRMLWCDGESVPRPATTTGAGDAATAGLIAGVLLGETPERALALAVAHATATIQGRRRVI